MEAINDMLQHVNVKFFLNDPEKLDQGAVLNLFHEWIQEDKIDDLLIDVADYRHVPQGPGVILVAHNAFYSLDNNEGRLGLLFNRRTAVEGEAQQVIAAALKSARDFARLLLGAGSLQGQVQCDRRTLQLAVNDRHFAQNTDESLAELQPAIEGALKEALGDRSYSLKRTADPRSRFTVEVTCDSDFDL